MNFGKAIKLVRTARGLSQRGLSERLGVDPSFVSLLESNQRKPSTETLERLATSLDVPLHLVILLGSEKSDLHGMEQKQIDAVAKSLLNLVLEADNA